MRPSESVFLRGICRKLVEGMLPHTRSTFLPICLSCRPPPLPSHRSVHTPFDTRALPQKELGAGRCQEAAGMRSRRRRQPPVCPNASSHCVRRPACANPNVRAHGQPLPSHILPSYQRERGDASPASVHCTTPPSTHVFLWARLSPHPRRCVRRMRGFEKRGRRLASGRRATSPWERHATPHTVQSTETAARTAHARGRAGPKRTSRDMTSPSCLASRPVSAPNCLNTLTNGCCHVTARATARRTPLCQRH